MGVLSAMVSDVSDRETRTRGMATVGVAYSIAFLVGPPASSWLLGRLFFNPQAGVSVLGPHIGLTAASLALLDYLCLFMLPETAVGVDKEKRHDDTGDKKDVSYSVVVIVCFDYGISHLVWPCNSLMEICSLTKQ